MSEYRETRKIVQAVPVRHHSVVETQPHPVVETRRDAVVHERRGVSGAEVTALVLAAIAAAVVITMLVMSNQQRNRDDELVRERAAAVAQQTPTPTQMPAQPLQQPAVVVPQSPPTAAPAPVPVPAQAAPVPSSTQLELAITSGLLEDSDLRSVAIDVKVADGVAILSGQVSTEELKTRAGRIAKRVKGISSVNNDIVVQP